jgi:hypothetical protein
MVGARAPWRAVVLGALLAACRDEGSSSHVYRAPAPAAPRPVVVASPPAPELPVGLMGPEARITGVSDAATGAPVSLSGINGAFSVMTLVSRGPWEWTPDAGARIEFVIDGPTDTTLVLALTPPASVLVAHAFTVPVRRAGGTGLRSGNYSAHVRLVMRGNESRAESTPIYFVVNR